MEKETQDIKQTQLTAEAHLNKFIAFAQKNKAALAIYRLPNDSKLQLLCDLSGGNYIEELNLEDLSPGFIVHPFQTGIDKIVSFDAEILAEISLNPANGASSKRDVLDWKKSPSEEIEKEIENTNLQFDFNLLENSSNHDSTLASDYIDMVEKGIQFIKREEFYKVVPSKIKNIESNNDINLGQAFINACKKYPNAFVNLTYSSKTGLWFGASPETLIEDKKGEYFKTMALAGTQAKSEKSIAETTWTQKEIEEQAYVSRYIINCFKKIRLRDFDEIGPKTIQAGNLLHLKTTFKVNTESVNFPELGSVMLKLLHPTSAVCGMPKESALDFISKEEKHNRGYFSGFMGPVHLNNLSHLFVNLRCCQIYNQSVTFYAGAGITEDSKAEKEWEETEMKCKVLSNIIFGI
ncbi:chorismate-binding protein [Marivirga salinae]|uniref:Chorismate-binding protein n=1 Tax=Marivirga salinarum TaxID=3059078 RepID=A0AA51NDE4_9BACT|nr:chorismate-binding protein [Marivirga sp. BDSF4-3]WMN11560.1 chorismate-binding protein [Marivirga sp. BDSF4-3]